MSKALSGLERLSQILRFPFREETQVLPRRSFPPGFSEDFFDLLKAHPEIAAGDYQLLDGRLPIQEGRGRVDFVAGNRKGELVFVWVFEKIDIEGLCRLIPSYDWIKKNRGLFQHLFSVNAPEKSMKLKVWVFAREIEGEAESMLPYLKDISLKLFKIGEEGSVPSSHHATAPEPEDPTGAKNFSRNALAYLKAQSPGLTPLSKPEEKPLKARTLPVITPEEAKDLTRAEIAFSESPASFEEDEITDPLINLSELRWKETSGGEGR